MLIYLTNLLICILFSFFLEATRKVCKYAGGPTVVFQKMLHTEQCLAYCNHYCVKCTFSLCKLHTRTAFSLQNVGYRQPISMGETWINKVHTEIQWLLILVIHQIWEKVMVKDKQEKKTLPPSHLEKQWRNVSLGPFM